MKNIIATALVGLSIAALGMAPANASSLPKFVGIDTQVSAHGYATATYQGQTYHLTEGDTLAGVTVVLIDGADHEVIVKQGSHLVEYRFSR